jgi:hypothetical protein
MEYQHGSHSVYDIKYHLVWVTKYRYHVLKGEVACSDTSPCVPDRCGAFPGRERTQVRRLTGTVRPVLTNITLCITISNTEEYYDYGSFT